MFAHLRRILIEETLNHNRYIATFVKRSNKFRTNGRQTIFKIVIVPTTITS